MTADLAGANALIGRQINAVQLHINLYMSLCLNNHAALVQGGHIKEPDLPFEDREINRGRVSLKVSALLCLQMPVGFTLAGYQLTWCPPCLCSVAFAGGSHMTQASGSTYLRVCLTWSVMYLQ